VIKSAVGGLVVLALTVLTPATASANQSREVYVSDNGADRVSVFRTDGAGQLLGSPSTVTANDAEGMAFSADGRFFYVSDSNTGMINAFTVAADGSLTASTAPGVAAGGAPYGITATPDGRFLFTVTRTAGTVRGYAIGANGGLSIYPGNERVIDGSAGPYGVVVSSDSRSLYVTDENRDELRAYTISTAGTLTEKAGSPIATGDAPYSAQITPDGRTIYVGNYTSDNISAYGIAADGTVAELPGSPFAGVDAPRNGMAISPDGRRLYVTSQNGGNVVPYAIAADGSLTAGTPVAAGSQPNGVAIAPDGKHVFVSAGLSRQVFSFAVQPDGTLAADGAPQALANPGYSEFQSVAIRPNQGPTARLTSRTAQGVVTLDASGSTDSDGTVASYRWDFGDGTTATTAAPTVQHTYADGTRQATVTITDDEGCSTSLVTTGLSALCNGSAAATTSTSVVAGVMGVAVTAKKQQLQKRALKVRVSGGAAEAVTVTVTGVAKLKGLKRKVQLKQVSTQAAPGVTAALKLVAKKKAQGKAAVGHKGTATITVTITDADGYVVTRTLRVKLK